MGACVEAVARPRKPAFNPARRAFVGVGVALNLLPARPVAMGGQPRLGRLRRRLPRPPSGPFFGPARYFFAGPLFFASAALGWLKTRAPRSPAKKGRGGVRSLRAPSLPPSRLMLAEKERPKLPSSSEPVAAGGSLFLDGTLPLPSPGPEPWAPDDAAARVWLARRRIDRDRGFARRGPSPFWGHRTGCRWGPGLVDPGPVWLAHCCLSLMWSFLRCRSLACHRRIATALPFSQNLHVSRCVTPAVNARRVS